MENIKEEVMFRSYSVDLFNIRNRIIMDTLEDYKEEDIIDTPEGMKGIIESEVYVVKRINEHFKFLGETTRNNNLKLATRIKTHLSQILSVVLTTAKYNGTNKEVKERIKLDNLCILTLRAISSKASYFDFG